MRQGREDGAWLDAVAILGAVADGDKPVAAAIVRTSTQPIRLAEHLVHLLSAAVRLSGVDAERFVETSRQCPPPPPIPPVSDGLARGD